MGGLFLSYSHDEGHTMTLAVTNAHGPSHQFQLISLLFRDTMQR